MHHRATDTAPSWSRATGMAFRSWSALHTGGRETLHKSRLLGIAAQCQLRKSARVRIGERSAHGVDRDSCYEAREDIQVVGPRNKISSDRHSARSIFSKALNFCRSAIAALVRSP